MKKIIKSSALLLALVMALGIFLAGCGKDDKKDEGDKGTDKKFTLVVGFDASFPPYGYKDKKTGEYVGFDLDLAKEVAKRNDWDVKLQAIDWKSKDMELKSGTINCLWNGFTINGREDDYTWSNPYVDNSQVVVVKKDSGIKTLADLKGKIVMVQAGSSAETALTNEKDNEKNLALTKTFKQLDKIKDYDMAFTNLEAGSVDAIAMDIGVAQFRIKKTPDKFVILEEQIATEQYGVGFKKGNTELRDKVQKTLDEMIKDGTFLKIAEKWDLEGSVILAD